MSGKNLKHLIHALCESGSQIPPHFALFPPKNTENRPKNTENDVKNTENGLKNIENGPQNTENGPKNTENDIKMPENGARGLFFRGNADPGSLMAFLARDSTIFCRKTDLYVRKNTLKNAFLVDSLIGKCIFFAFIWSNLAFFWCFLIIVFFRIQKKKKKTKQKKKKKKKKKKGAPNHFFCPFFSNFF
jgi:hypothetical protein